jgi:Ser/Thr protein kinase RdoA (MazF antagonist)
MGGLMMENNEILLMLKSHYPMNFIDIMLLREGGNATYAVYTDQKKFFLKIVGSAFSDTFNMSVDINLYLLENGFSVPNIIMTADNKPFIEDEKKYIILYEFLETTEIDMEKDAEAVGLLIGQLHHLMSGYKGELITHDKQFYVERYIDILIKKQYPKFDEFKQYSEMLWNRIKSLPRGYSHGDMYCGNIARGSDGKLYVLDFDTSCIGFPLYDLALICNQTDYFDYDTEGLSKTTAIYKRLLPEYLKNYKLTDREINSLNNMIALYHFALQATIIEIYGLDCVDNAFFDKQLDWLKQWEIQCKSVG